MHDPDLDVLVYRTTDPAQMSELLEQLDGAQEFEGLDQGLIGVPRNLFNCQVMAWHGFAIPDVIDPDYPWPIQEGRTPLAHQRVMANFMAARQRCFNLTSMGGMKTMGALWATDWLMTQYPPGTCRCLVVAPLSTLYSVWRDTIRKNFPDRKVQVLHGTRQSRWLSLESNADYYVINFAGLQLGAGMIDSPDKQRHLLLTDFAKRLEQRIQADIRMVICDEFSAYRNPATLRFKVGERLYGTAEYFWGMTGSPTPNAPTDAWGLAKIVNDAFGEKSKHFRERTMEPDPHRPGHLRPTPNGYEEAAKLLQPSIRIDIRTVWDAPPLTTTVREVELTKGQKAALKQLRDEMMVELENGAFINAVNEAVKRTKLLQIVLGAVYDGDRKAHLVDAKPRLEELVECIEQANRKVVIFSPFTSVVNLIYDHLSELGHKCAKITGSTSLAQRTEIIRLFQDDTEPLNAIIADPGCMAHGIELFAADVAIYYGPTDSNETYQQSIKRLHRPGQRYPVTVVQLVATRTETTIFHRLESKETLQGIMLDALTRGTLE
jgi:SNF2 family DNA or RNA helicase